VPTRSAAGAAMSEVSIPLHRDGIHIWNAIAVEGATAPMVTGNSIGTNWKGHYTTSLLDFYGRSIGVARVVEAHLQSVGITLHARGNSPGK
jgi:hypothetical protein